MFSKQDKKAGKGFFFTFIAFLVIMAVFAVSVSINESKSKQNEAVADQSAFDSINNRFNEIYNRTISIKTGERGEIQGKILPYSYHSGTDWITVQQYLPLMNSPVIYSNTFDALNLYEIFTTTKDISHEYDMNITAQKNAGWGGTDINFTSVILPQCVSIEPAEPSNISQILLRKGTATVFDYCPADFPSNTAEAIKKIEVMLEFSTSSDVLAPVCGGDFAGCLNNADLSNGTVYAVVDLNISSCNPQCSGVCCITTPSQAIAANITGTSYIEIPFSGAGEQIRVDFENGDEIVKVHEENLNVKGVLSTVKVTFVDTIRELHFSGFEKLKVSKPNFGIERKSG